MEKEIKFNSSNQLPTEINVDLLINSITAIITEISSENMDDSKKDLRDAQMSLSFYAKNIPSIQIKNYFERILKYTKMEATTVIIVLIYIDKICENANFLITSNNIHR